MNRARPPGKAGVDQVTGRLPAGPLRPVPVSRELRDGDELSLGDGAVLVAAPGHTPGSAALDTEIACFGHSEPMTRDAGDLLRAAAGTAGAGGRAGGHDR